MIEASESEIAPDARVDEAAAVCVERLQIGAGARIGAGADICCDELVLGPGAEIGADVRITTPRCELGEQAAIGSGCTVELNERLVLADYGRVGDGVVMKGQSVDCGERLDMGPRVVVGGGGWASADSRLIVGDRVSIREDCFLNLSDRVTIGDDSELEAKVSVITHGAYHDPLVGYAAQFEAVAIGQGVSVQYDSKLLPGVTVGDRTVVGVGSVVIKDLPADCHALGSPARVASRADDEEHDPAAHDETVRSVLLSWAELLALKGVDVSTDDLLADDSFEVEWHGVSRRVGYDPLTAERERPGDCAITISARGDGTARGGETHFDLKQRVLSGSSDPLVDDLREYLATHGMRIPGEAPAQSLPLTEIARLRAQRSS